MMHLYWTEVIDKEPAFSLSHLTFIFTFILNFTHPVLKYFSLHEFLLSFIHIAQFTIQQLLHTFLTFHILYFSIHSLILDPPDDDKYAPFVI